MSSTDERGDRLNRALELLTAVANEDASVEDIVARMRAEGIDSLELLVSLVAGLARQPSSRRRAQQWVDTRRFWTATPTEQANHIVHRVPHVPFLLNGTLYDPADVRRFDGRELHFVVAPGKTMLAFDDRDTIARWWELTFFQANSDAVGAYQYGGYQFQSPTTPQDSGAQINPSTIPPGPPVPASGGFTDHTLFFEDADFQGERLELPPNRGYWDLTEVHQDSAGLGNVFGLGGNWNDKISSVNLGKNHVAKLHEHIHWEGDTLTIISSFTGTNRPPQAVQQTDALGHLVTTLTTAMLVPDLTPFGWNCRASSVETW